MYYRMVFDVVRICPNSEERILEAVVDKLCQIDVDIKNPKSRRKCSAFSSLPKIQTMSAFLKEISLKVPNERETKMGVLFEMLLNYIKERILIVPKSSESDEEFIDLLLKIFENKIFPIYKINFM